MTGAPIEQIWSGIHLGSVHCLQLSAESSHCPNGKQSARRPGLHFLDHDTVMRACRPEGADILRPVTGDNRVSVCDRDVRAATGKSGRPRIASDQGVWGAAHRMQGDRILASAPWRRRDCARSPART
ncbi:MAG: hypothetical protein OXF33_00800 [Rhodospirillales bacterium]|nr:hypothetical protein [Rhodospirillales bacterium]